jgi:hypothetical protein
VHASQLRDAVRALLPLRSRPPPPQASQPTALPEGRSLHTLDRARPHGCRNARRWSSFKGGCFREGLRTAVLERIPALLSSDDCGSSVEREAQGQVLWRVQHEGCWRKWELRAAVALVRTGQDRTGQDRTGQDRTGQDRTAASTATFLKCGAHALLGSLPVRAQWPGFEAAGPAACSSARVLRHGNGEVPRDPAGTGVGLTNRQVVARA